MSKLSFRGALALTVSAVTLLIAAGAHAEAAAASGDTGAGAEGADVGSVIVTAERSKAAATAPTKASLEEMQPESIISQKFIEQSTKENGSWVSVASIAPSVSGITANGGGVGETTKLTLRGFQDGQFNMTYDGIAFGDTNGPTHHEASYWPSSTIGAVVIDRGPGAAGDLGPSNYGGAIHLFSPTVSDTFGASQKLTYGSFSTIQSVTTLNTGVLPKLGGGKLLVSLMERDSRGELTYSGGSAQNQLAKFILPVGSNWQFTLFGSHNYTRFYQNDGSGAGETGQQLALYGKNFALTNITLPNGNPEEHNYKLNQQAKQTDFEYADMKGGVTPSVTVEDQLYTYYYKNATKSASDNTALIGSNAGSFVSAVSLQPGQAATDLQGYDKLNEYRVWGNVIRLNKDFSFGTLKVGGLYEWATTNRHNLLLDLNTGTPNIAFVPGKSGLPAIGQPNALSGPTNAKLQENSAWQDYQLFADFYWRPTDSITITPGFKYVHDHLNVRAADEKTSGGLKNQPLFDSRDVSSPLYFITGNYKITPNWSVYGQFATSFSFPDITSLYFANAGLGGLKSQTTKSYQVGTVYSRGAFTADFDAYRVDAENLIQTCNVPAIPGVRSAESFDCNVGKARYTGFEGEAAYAFDFGLTLFANGSSNVAKQMANAANPGAGILANPAEELQNSPRYTAAGGAVYNNGPWAASVTYKKSGNYVVYGGAKTLNLPGYDTIDMSGAYDFGHFKLKLSAFNLADKRAITSLKPVSTTDSLYKSDAAYYEFQAGREVQVTLEAKF